MTRSTRRQAGSGQNGKRPTTPKGRAPLPGFTVKIVCVGGPKGAKLESIQLQAIREVLQWLNNNPPRSQEK